MNIYRSLKSPIRRRRARSSGVAVLMMLSPKPRLLSWSMVRGLEMEMLPGSITPSAGWEHGKDEHTPGNWYWDVIQMIRMLTRRGKPAPSLTKISSFRPPKLNRPREITYSVNSWGLMACPPSSLPLMRLSCPAVPCWLPRQSAPGPLPKRSLTERRKGRSSV